MYPVSNWLRLHTQEHRSRNFLKLNFENIAKCYPWILRCSWAVLLLIYNMNKHLQNYVFSTASSSLIGFPWPEKLKSKHYTRIIYDSLHVVRTYWSTRTMFVLQYDYYLGLYPSQEIKFPDKNQVLFCHQYMKLQKVSNFIVPEDELKPYYLTRRLVLEIMQLHMRFKIDSL